MASVKVSRKTYNNFSGRKSKGTNGSISSKANAYLAACNNQQASEVKDEPEQSEPIKPSFPRFESVSRIAAIPIVGSGIELSEKLYVTIKESSSIAKWSLMKAEISINSYMTPMTISAVNMFNGPITKIDQILCKSLDIVEQRVPSITLPPEQLYTSAQDYVNCHIVKPVLKRADSVKQIGSAVLDSKMTAYAADRVDSVLDKAEVYVDKYLPDDSKDEPDGVCLPQETAEEGRGPRQQVMKTMKHADRFSRKVGRRISLHTMREARAFKEHTTEAIHVLLYVAELVATDPTLALAKARELWTELSQDEPENQSRPDTLEHLMVLITRETARRLVHLINYTSRGAVKLPKTVVRSIRDASHQFLGVAHTLVQKVNAVDVKKNIMKKADDLKSRLQVILEELQEHSRKILEQLAKFIAGGSSTTKLNSSRCRIRNNHIYANPTNALNGVNN